MVVFHGSLADLATQPGLVGGLEHLDVSFPHRSGIMIPTDQLPERMEDGGNKSPLTYPLVNVYISTV